MTATTALRPPTLVVIPAGTRPTRCNGCNAVIYFVGKQPIRVAPQCVSRTSGKAYDTPSAIAPTETEPGQGFNHYADCPAADRFRRR